MNFAENLKQVRKAHHLSQEDLAELLDVSRQAVSKWEQGAGYPEVEKLLLLSEKLNVSLDSLMATGISKEGDVNGEDATGNITITSPYENVIAVNCYKVCSSQKFRGGKGAPRYALLGFNSGSNSFWGETAAFLGWYEDKEQITKEIGEIQEAIKNGVPTYKLKYSVKVEWHWFSVKMAPSKETS